MKGFCSHPVTKVVACLLAVILSGVCTIAAGAVVFMYAEGYYDETAVTYYDTGQFRFISYRYADSVYQHWQNYSGPIGQISDQYTEQETNFAYTIAEADAPNKILAFNYDASDSAYHVSYEFGNFQNYVVNCYISNPIVKKDWFYDSYLLFQWLYPNRYHVITAVLAGALLILVALAILIAGAGRYRGAEGVVLRGQDKIPLDLYLFAGGMIEIALIIFIGNNFYYENYWGWIFVGWIAMVICCVGIAMLQSLAARFKAGGWWRNTVLYHVLCLCRRCLRVLWRMVAALAKAIPLIWKILLCFCAAVFINYFLQFLAFWNNSGFALLLSVMFNLALFLGIGFCALNMQRLKQAGERLAEGDFEQRVDKQWMVLDFLQHAHNLDSIGDGMAIAVQQRIKSERLKTELITNVSHDIKTPLTSIINYVDLLQKEPLPEKAAEYTAVLEKHSKRLKKLTEDIVEASKASTGNLPVLLQKTDLCELVNQSVGEYAERLEECRVEPVAAIPEEELFIMADGKLLWRVMDNLLGNVCKYTQPETRLYIDVQRQGGQVSVVLKNISRSRLNVAADELTQRFARGDSSRATEGSGLGLNIAQSLVELQKGSFGLAIDGDLFKVELRFALID